mgnify:CR=1 FL=1
MTFQVVDADGVILTFDTQEEYAAWHVEQGRLQGQQEAANQSPLLGERQRRIADIKVGDIDIDWSLTQYANIANGENFDDFWLSDLLGLAGLPVFDLTNIEGDPFLSDIEGIDWSLTNYNVLVSGTGLGLDDVKLSEIGESIIIDPLVKDLESIKGTYLEDMALVQGVSPLAINEDMSLSEAMLAWAERSLDDGTLSEEDYANFLENFDPEAIDAAGISIPKTAEELEEATNTFEEVVKATPGKEDDIIVGAAKGFWGFIKKEILEDEELFGKDEGEDPELVSSFLEDGVYTPPSGASPLRFSELEATSLETETQDVTSFTVVESIKDLTETEQKILAENIFLHMPDVYGSWEEIYEDDGSLNLDTFGSAVNAALARAQTAAQLGLGDQYVEMFLIDDLSALDKNAIRQHFQEKIAELQAKDQAKTVLYTDPASLTLKIDDYFKRVTGRGATDEEVRDFINMYHDLQRESTPTAKQLREGGFEMTSPSLEGQGMAFAEDRAPVEAGAMQTVEKAGLIMQALGMGQ